MTEKARNPGFDLLVTDEPLKPGFPYQYFNARLYAVLIQSCHFLVRIKFTLA